MLKFEKFKYKEKETLLGLWTGWIFGQFLCKLPQRVTATSHHHHRVLHRAAAKQRENRALCTAAAAALPPPPLQYAVNRAQLPRGQHPTCRTQLRLVTASQRRRRHLWRRYHTRSAATARALCTTKQALLMQAVVSSCPRDFQMTRLCV